MWSSTKLHVGCGQSPPQFSLSVTVSSSATCLTRANKEVDVIKRNPIIQLILSGTLSRKASAFTEFGWRDRHVDVGGWVWEEKLNYRPLFIVG